MLRSSSFIQPHPHKSIRYPTTARRLPSPLKRRMIQGLQLGIELSPNGRIRVPIERFTPGRVEMYIAGDPAHSFNILQADDGYVLPGYKGLMALMADTDTAVDFMKTKSDAQVFALPFQFEGRDLRVSGKQKHNADKTKVITKVQMDTEFGIWGLRRVESSPTKPDESQEPTLNNRYITVFHKSAQRGYLIQTGLSAYYDENMRHTVEWTMGVGALNYGASETQAATVEPTNRFPINTIVKWTEENNGFVQHTLKVNKDALPQKVGRSLIKLLLEHFARAAATHPDEYSQMNHELSQIKKAAQDIENLVLRDQWIKQEVMKKMVHWLVRNFGSQHDGATLELLSKTGEITRIKIGGLNPSLPLDLSEFTKVTLNSNGLKVCLNTNRGKFYVQEKLHDIDNPEALQDQEMYSFMWQTLSIGAQIYSTHHKAH